MSDQMISISREELKALIAEGIAKERSGGDPNQRVMHNPTAERTVRVRTVNGKVVVGFKNKGNDSTPRFIYEVRDPNDPKRTISMVDLILEGEENGVSYPVGYIEFIANSDSVICKVSGKKEVPWTVEQGTVEVKTVPEGKYYATPSGYEVPVEIIGKHIIYTIAVPATETMPERTLDISELYVNM